MNINGSALAAYPDIVQAAVERNWEFVSRGFTGATCRQDGELQNERPSCMMVCKVVPELQSACETRWTGVQ